MTGFRPIRFFFMMFFTHFSTILAGAETTVTVNAGQDPKAYHPVWIKAGSKVTFTVEGSWTMWYPSWRPVDWRGHTYFRRIHGFRLGTLMGGVEGGEPVPIRDGMEWTSSRSGYLVLYPHRERYKHLKARGRLSVTVSGVVRRPFVLSGSARRILDDYRRSFLGSNVTDLGWSGSLEDNNPGTLPQRVLDRMLMRVNYFRRLAGLAPVVFTTERNRRAQHAAFIMLANKRLSHYPPSSWRGFTEDGKAGARSSNLGLSSLNRLLTEFIEDPGAKNKFCGHRRWLLYSRATEFGFGAAYDSSHYAFAAEALYVTGRSRKPKRMPAFIAWPPAGYVPAPLVFGRGSFSLPVRASAVSLENATVSMSGPGGERIPVRVHPLRRVGDPGITWDILPANTNLSGFRLRWNNRPITVRIGGIRLNGVEKRWEYRFTLIAP